MGIQAALNVSVIIACYKQAQYVRGAALSALSQTAGQPEVIVVDDCDPEPGQIQDALYGLPVKIIRNKTNLGLAGSRNEGIRHSTGEYILPCDSDDFLFPNAVEKLCAALDKYENAAVGFGNAKLFGDYGGEWICKHGWPLRELLIENQLPYASMFRKSAWEAVGGYCDEMRLTYQDWDLWISLAERYLLIHIPEYVLLYRKTKGSMFDEAVKEHVKIVEFIASRHRHLYQHNDDPATMRKLQAVVAWPA